MDLSAFDLVLPLQLAENHFLQVLLTRFTLTRHGSGAQLLVRFDQNTHAIWRRHAKADLQAAMPDFDAKAARYQQQLDDFLVRGEGESFQFDDADFPFRYGGGGVLPIVRMGEKEYYCMFYREIYPIGWNIANGGCDSRDELLNPLDTIERELREELLVLDPRNRRQYVFDWDARKSLDRPEFAVARRFWRQIMGRDTLDDFQQLEIPLKWLDGPDVLKVQFGDAAPVATAGCYLNVNGEDFGIEIDKIAKINVDEDCVLCDGEIVDDQLVASPVGLFEVDRFNRELREGVREFLPDLFFYDGRRHEGRELERIVHENFLPAVSHVLTQQEIDAFAEAPVKYDLCPVTRRVAERYAASSVAPPATKGDKPEVFISFASEDRPLARQVFEFVAAVKGRRVFFSDESLHDSNFSRQIDDALDAARSMVVVGTRADHLNKRWVEYEWRSFHNDINNGHKPADAQLISFISGFSPADLPRPLRHRQTIVCESGRTDTGLNELRRWIN